MPRKITEKYESHLQVKIPPTLEQAIDRAANAHFMSKQDFVRVALGLACKNGFTATGGDQ